MRPVIGITTRPREIDTSAGRLGADTVQHTYRMSVSAAGGLPVLLAPVETDDVPVLLSRVDGLVLTGGGDVDPARYGGRRDDTMYGVDEERDGFELALARRAAALRMPVLAICRGLQVVNVALGGTLVSDIPTVIGSTDHAFTGDDVFRGHQHVSIEPSCGLASLVGTDLVVNSIHHQSVDRLGDGLVVVGKADDGVIEAVESVDAEWPLIAVQWHPEYLADAGDPAAHTLFEALVKAAGSR
jgi:putative glutamine amidotransferase